MPGMRFFVETGTVCRPHVPGMAIYNSAMRLHALLAAALLTVSLHAQTHAAKTHHVVFVITSDKPVDWQRTMTLSRNFMRGVAPEPTDIEVLAYGDGIRILANGATTAQQMPELQKQGVHFVACENAMRSEKLTTADLLPGVTTVPSGVVELVRKQEAGFSYVKVGE